MIEKRDFTLIRKQIERAEQQRQRDIECSRTVVKISKQCIYAVMRGALAEAKTAIGVMQKNIKNIKEPTQLRIAEQEYAEACCFYSFVKQGNINTAKTLHVQPENYLLGICDLFGELARYAVNSAIRKDDTAVYATKKVMSELYNELLKFDFRNGELRRKFDGTKYELVKVEKLVLDYIQNKKE